MIRTNLARLTSSKRSLLAVLASSALLTAGCSNLATTATNSTPLDSAQALSGKVHGGNQPIVGATVNLYFAGQGAPATQAATTTTDANGNFTFTNSATSSAPNNYICPASGQPGANSLVYAVAKGGNTIGDGNTSESNTAAAFIGIYGDCGKNALANSNITFTEVTTVATLLAAQQFFDPATESLTADNTGSAKDAIDTTVATVNNMVNLATGYAVSSSSISGSGSNGGTGVTVTATPESTKINLMANIMTSCVNNISASAPNCQSLFAAAVPPNPKVTNHPGSTFAPATDVLQALYYMLTNPTTGGSANMTTLFGLASGAGAPFAPALATQPLDWTVAISYSSNSTCGAGNGGLFSAPNSILIDEFAQVWLTNGQATSGNLVGLLSNGKAIYCIATGAGTSAGNGALFIDYLDNIWSSVAGAATLSRYSPNSSPASAPVSFTAPAAVLAIAGDSNGNVFFSTASGLYEIVGAATAPAGTTPTLITSTVTNATSLFFDSNASLWAVSGAGTLYRVQGTTVSTFNVSPAATGLTLTNSNDVFVSSTGSGNGLSYFTNDASPQTGYAMQNGYPLASPLGGLNQPASIALDGAKNVWIANNSANTGGLFSVSEITPAGVPLSPDTAAGGFQKGASYLNASSSLVVDQAGNVWVVGGASSNNFVTEIVGAGVPICQPYAYCIFHGRFQGNP